MKKKQRIKRRQQRSEQLFREWEIKLENNPTPLQIAVQKAVDVFFEIIENEELNKE